MKQWQAKHTEGEEAEKTDGDKEMQNEGGMPWGEQAQRQKGGEQMKRCRRRGEECELTVAHRCWVSDGTQRPGSAIGYNYPL